MMLPSKQRLERIWMLAKTDYFQRYYGSVLGVLWAFLNPFFRVLVYYFAFTYLIYKSKDSQFILYLFSGIAIWTVFSENTSKSLRLLKSKKYLIQNIGIEKLDLFISSALSTVFSFILNIVVYLLFTLLFDVHFSWRLLVFFPLLAFNLYLLAIGVSMILSVIHLYLKDLNHLWDVILFLGFWTVPIIWNYEFVYSEYPFFLYLNPMVGILINFRFILLFDMPIDTSVFFLNYLYAFVIFGMGYWLLKKYSYKAVEMQ